MADASEKSANYRLTLLGNAKEVSVETTGAMLGLYDSITKSNAAIKAMQQANRALVGSDKETIAAKEQLIAFIDEEKIAVGKANLELLKQGATYGKLAADAKAASAATGNSIQQIGGPVQEVIDHFRSLQTVLDGSKTAMGAMAVSVAIVTTALLAFTVAATAAAFALGKWIVESASFVKTQQLAREAFAGSAENAKHLGEQVDDLARRVALPTEEINQLGIALIRTRLSGPAVVDAMNAIGQATSAAGKDVGAAVQEWITRGQMWNRFRLNPLEMQGSGVQFNDVAAQLSKNLGIGLGKAQLALRQEAVRIEDGAKAIRQVVEKNFGSINAQKMLTIDNITQTWSKHLKTLFDGVDYAKLIDPLNKIMSLFDATSVTGYALRQLITELFGSMSDAFEGGVPLIKTFVEQFTIAALELHTSLLNLSTSFIETFHFDITSPSNVFKAAMGTIAIAAGIATIALFGLAAAGIASVAPMLVAAAPFIAIGLAITGATALIVRFIHFFEEQDWKVLGAMVSKGFADGIMSGLAAVTSAVETVSGNAITAIKKSLGIYSPSKVFEEFGDQTAEGFSLGVSGGATDVQTATNEMVPDAPRVSKPFAPTEGAAPSFASKAGGPISLTVNINVAAGKTGQDVADKLSSPSFMAQLTKAIEEMMMTAGVPTQSTVMP